MLADILIENFALIDNAEIHFSPKFNVLTGESGSGKSIIVDSLNFVLGERLKKTPLSEDKSVRVQARFEIDKSCSEEILNLKLAGIIEEDSVELILTRRLFPSGKNLYHINGELVPQKVYRQVGISLVDIHGQRDNQFLLNVSNQRLLLDLFAGNKAQIILQNLEELYKKYRQISSEIEQLKDKELERNREIDWTLYEIEEIESAELKTGEEEDLEREKRILENAEKITSASLSICQYLSEDHGVIDKLNSVSRELNRWGSFDDSIDFQQKTIEGILEQLQELSFICREKSEEIGFSQEKLDSINARLHKIERLKSKYGQSIEEILQYLNSCKEKLESLETASLKIESLQQELNEVREKWLQASKELSVIRKETASCLEQQLLSELSSLGMKEAKFMVNIAREEGEILKDTEIPFNITPYGLDHVEFLIGPNLGIPVKPLNMIASGGELSRITLALRSIFSNYRNFSTLVMDEIDTGLGGISASEVAEKIKQISGNRQVICVTHLPVIAALADNHIHIEKVTEGRTTRTIVTSITGSSRVQEVMRMLAGNESSQATRKLAEKLLK